MITWLTLLPLFVIPFIAISLIGLLPELSLGSLTISGQAFQEWLAVNVLAWSLPDAAARIFASWYVSLMSAERYAFHLLVALNINTVLLPFFYVVGVLLISISGALTVYDNRAKRALVKR